MKKPDPLTVVGIFYFLLTMAAVFGFVALVYLTGGRLP